MFGRLGTLLVGGAIGAGLAMLMNPRSGQETQAQLRERMRGIKDQYGPMIEQGRIRATELVQSGRDVLDQTQTKVNAAIDRSRTAQDQNADRSPEDQAEGQQPPHQPLS
jgi:gas vesicle protein